MGFAERMAQACISSDLEAVEDKIHAVEHVAALSGASSLGSDLMRAKDYDVQALRRAIIILAKKARYKYRLAMNTSISLATAAIAEILHWQCHRCHGASELIIGGIRKNCPECGGTGVHRWTDKQRAKHAGIDSNTWGSLEKHYNNILLLARKDDSSTLGLAHKKLGKSD